MPTNLPRPALSIEQISLIISDLPRSSPAHMELITKLQFFLARHQNAGAKMDLGFSQPPKQEILSTPIKKPLPKDFDTALKESGFDFEAFNREMLERQAKIDAGIPIPPPSQEC